MRTIYELDGNRIWTKQSRQITDKDGRPPRWIETDLTPPDGITQWRGNGWGVLTNEEFNAITEAQAELQEKFAELSRRTDPETLLRALEVLASTSVDLNTLDDPDAAVALYPEWHRAQSVAVGDVRAFEGVLYRAIQAHTTQADWTPPAVPALWVRVKSPDGSVAAWVQPTGAQDAYATGDRVTHDNPNDAGTIWIYESAIDANTTEPGRDGTFDRYWTPIQPA